MIQTVYSNSYEFLRKLLINYIQADVSKRRINAGPTAVFHQDIVIAPTEAVKDDIQRSLCDEIGIASVVKIEFLGQWMESITGTLIGKSRSGDELQWIILSLLRDPAFLAQPQCQRLKHYVVNQSAEMLPFLAQRIGNVFTTYVSYRLDWVLEWIGVNVQRFGRIDSHRVSREKKVLENHPDFAWQKALWREIASARWGTNLVLLS